MWNNLPIEILNSRLCDTSCMRLDVIMLQSHLMVSSRSSYWIVASTRWRRRRNLSSDGYIPRNQFMVEGRVPVLTPGIAFLLRLNHFFIFMTMQRHNFHHQQQSGTKMVDVADMPNDDEAAKGHKSWHAEFCCFHLKHRTPINPIFTFCPWNVNVLWSTD